MVKRLINGRLVNLEERTIPSIGLEFYSIEKSELSENSSSASDDLGSSIKKMNLFGGVTDDMSTDN